MSAQAQQAAPPGEALRRLSTGLAQQRRPQPLPDLLLRALPLLLTGFFAGGILLYLSASHYGGVVLVLLGFIGFIVSPTLVGKESLRQQKAEQLQSALLLILKDQADRVSCADLLFGARTLPPHAAAPLPELLRARLAEKLPYAAAAELAELEPADRQWLRSQLTAPEVTEALLVAVLFALGTLRDGEAQDALLQLAAQGRTERIREAAHDALMAGMRAR